MSNYEEFRIALQHHPEAVADLPLETYRKYAKGDLPRQIRWLLRHPRFMRQVADLMETGPMTPIDPRVATGTAIRNKRR